MGWLRLRRMLRCKYMFRFGAVGYVVILLFVVATWTSIQKLTAPGVEKTQKALPDHVHLTDEDIKRRQSEKEGVSVTRRPTNQPKFSRTEYASNHSHPVRAVPAVAESPPPAKKSLAAPCAVVREVEFFGQKLTLEGDPLCTWLTSPAFSADGHFVQYGDKMALLYDVLLDPGRLAEKGPRGGEEMDKVWGQNEEAEYLKMKEGFFTLNCVTKPEASFEPKDHLARWMKAVDCSINDTKSAAAETVKGLTIAVQRYEYVNLYHTMTDFFNAFLAMLMFNQHPDDVTVLWVDAHPRGGLDGTWDTLFGQVVRAGTLSSPTRFSAMAWAAMGYYSPIYVSTKYPVSYLEEFRHFFLSRHGVDSGRTANCSSLNWLFIWRRDYTAHPRNKAGRISRKIDNEDEVLAAVKDAAGPGDRIEGLQLDAFPMKTQLKLISETDVLLGMHGAGLTHTLFLPLHGGLLEFYPTYWPQANRHFRLMARWRGLHYQTWQNHDQDNEKPDHRTYIPPQVVAKMVKEMRKNICS